MKKKSIIIITTCAILATAAVATGIYFTVSANNKKHTVKTTMIDYVCAYDYDMMDSSLSGSVFSGGGQNVYLSEDDVIDKILVNEGDTVQIGTPIIALDSNKLKLDLDSCNLAVQQDDLKLQTANKTLQKYQSATPYVKQEETEAPEEPENSGISTDNIISEINNIAQAFEGDGSIENPYKFKCTADCTIFAPLFKSIEGENKYVTLYIYSEDIGDFAYTCILSPSGKNILINDDYTWQVGTIYTLADGTETIQLNNSEPKTPCEFSTYIPEGDYGEPDDDTGDIADEPDDDTVPDTIDGVYTQQELNQMISEKQKEIAELTIQKKEDELAAKKALDKYNKATITSTVNGVVSSIDSSAGGSSPVMVISDGVGLYVKTVIDEYSYSTVKAGDIINITSWTESGENKTTAKITSISPYPAASNNEYVYTSNKNVSFYPVTAQLENSEGMKADDYVSVSFKKQEDSSEQKIGIDKAYIGDDKGGKFLYLVDDKGYLKKTYVATGKTIYDSYLEIKEDIDTSGYIASPYTKYAKDGAKADMSDTAEN